MSIERITKQDMLNAHYAGIRDNHIGEWDIDVAEDVGFTTSAEQVHELFEQRDERTRKENQQQKQENERAQRERELAKPLAAVVCGDCGLTVSDGCGHLRRGGGTRGY